MSRRKRAALLFFAVSFVAVDHENNILVGYMELCAGGVEERAQTSKVATISHQVRQHRFVSGNSKANTTPPPYRAIYTDEIFRI